MQGKLFQRCTHLLYCSVLSLGGNVNTRRMSKPDLGSILHIKNNEIFRSKETIMWIIKIIKFKCFNPKQTLMHLFLFTNSAHGMETFLTKNRTRRWNRSSSKKTKNAEWNRNDRSSTQNGTGQNGKRTERLKKKAKERNDLAKGPLARTERND